MHWPVRIFCVVLTVLHSVEAPLSGTHYQGPGLAANWNDHRMRRSLIAGGGIPGGRKKLPLSLGFKCASCGVLRDRSYSQDTMWEPVKPLNVFQGARIEPLSNDG
jgi:hypothetical protein